MVISVFVDDSQVKRMLQRLGTQFPNDMDKMTERLAHRFTNSIRKSAILKRLNFKGRLIPSIRTTKLRKGEYGVNISQAGLFVDADWAGYQMEHWVNPRKHRRLYDWYRQSLKSPVKGKYGQVPAVVKVKAHPFIREPIEKEISKLSGHLNREVTRAIKKL